MMKEFPSASLLASVLLLAGAAVPALAQDGMTPPPGQVSPNPYVDSLGPDAPQPQTGELVPLPGPPPEGKDAEMKLPDCAPPNCGTPQIME
ncbi:hypothetical protein EV667_2510 [Ancylobacter aquaticus]|uniref:Uncharacterized protein n=1 Tax=Ancylobacter aquaticus TaxID=100 RepID=A0A4V2PJH4_ANCAQ|nr:hypothetical protein [Ancylobacter aquaticus]TCK28506.1 hypothetical protein EV667_2510 [Ancylobacter aquaticus]